MKTGTKYAIKGTAIIAVYGLVAGWFFGSFIGEPRTAVAVFCALATSAVVGIVLYSMYGGRDLGADDNEC